MNEEILKPFDLGGTFTVDNVRPDVPRDERFNFDHLDKSRTIAAQGILGIITIFEYA
jgi:hypothetical protein